MKKLMIVAMVALSLVLAAPAVNAGSDHIEVVAYNEHSRVIEINGRITESSFMEFMEATAFAKDIYITLILHTGGGDAFSTIGIINRIHELKKKGCFFETRVYSSAMSAGSYIWLEGDRRVIYEGATLMFHTMLQQLTPDRKEQIREDGKARVISMLERLDRYIAKRFKKLTAGKLSEKMQNYYLYGSPDPKKQGIGENGQYMSAETARNVALADEYIAIGD
jgi:ATP-dependent protease ClpP protease subunit